MTFFIAAHVMLLTFGLAAFIVALLSVTFKSSLYRKFGKDLKEKYNFKPTVSILLPLKGIDTNLKDTIKALIHQNYPRSRYEIIFIVDKGDKNTEQEIRRLVKGRKRVRVINSTILPNCAHKNSALLAGMKNAKNDYIVFLDSDAVPRKNWLCDLIGPLKKKEIGATTGHRFYMPNKGFLSYILCAWNNISLLQMFGRYAFMWGGSSAISKQLLKKLKVQELIKKTFSDDTQITQAVKKAGLKIKFVPSCIINSEMDEFFRLSKFTTRQVVTVRLYFKNVWRAGVIFYIGNLLAIIMGFATLFMYFATEQHLFLIESSLMLLTIFFGFLRASIDYANLKNLINAQIRSRTLYIAADFCAGVLMAYNILRAWKKKTLTWRGVTYRINSPYDIEIVERE